MLKKGQLGNAIRTARIRLNLSQEELAERIEITPTHLKHIESEHRKPSIEVLIRLMETLHFSLDELVFPVAANERQDYLRTQIISLLQTCTSNQLEIVNDLIYSLIKHTETQKS